MTEYTPMDDESRLKLILDEVLSVALERLKEGSFSDDPIDQGMAIAYADVLDRAEEMAEMVEYDLNSLGLDGQRMEARPAPPKRKAS